MKINIARDEAIKVIAERVGVPVWAAQETLKEASIFMTECLMAGASVSIPKLGILTVSDVAARDGINPQTGAKVSIDATKRVSFKSSKILKECLKESV